MKRTILLALALTAPLLAGEWTQFRGPGGRSVSDETGLPTKWSREDGIKWKVKLPGRGLSNPVIAGGKVYVTATSAYRETRLHVLCFDEKTGKKLWERQFAATGSTACHPVSNMAAPTPVTDGKAVYALFATGDLAALSADGTLLWYRSLVGDYPTLSNQVGMASSPVLADGVLCVPMDNVGESFFAGLDLKTGKNRWRHKRPSGLNWVTPVQVEMSGKKGVLFQGSDGAMVLEAKTGKPLWRHKAGLSTIPSPTAADGTLYLTAGGGSVKAVRPSEDNSAEELWSADGALAGYPSPVIYKGKLYGLTATHATCFDLQKGEKLWQERVEGGFSATPVLADGKMYVVNEKGRTTVIRLGEKPEVIARNELGDRFQATPAIANGCIYLRSDGWLYCIGGKK